MLELADAERAELRRLLRRRGVGQALAQRIRVVLACAEPGATNQGVAEALGVSRETVATWRRRFAERRLEGLVDAPRSGAPRSIGDEAVERLVGDCRNFRVWGRTMPLREPSYAATQTARHPG